MGDRIFVSIDPWVGLKSAVVANLARSRRVVYTLPANKTPRRASECSLSVAGETWRVKHEIYAITRLCMFGVLSIAPAEFGCIPPADSGGVLSPHPTGPYFPHPQLNT